MAMGNWNNKVQVTRLFGKHILNMYRLQNIILSITSLYTVQYTGHNECNKIHQLKVHGLCYKIFSL